MALNARCSSGGTGFMIPSVLSSAALPFRTTTGQGTCNWGPDLRVLHPRTFLQSPFGPSSSVCQSCRTGPKPDVSTQWKTSRVRLFILLQKQHPFHVPGKVSRRFDNTAVLLPAHSDLAFCWVNKGWTKGRMLLLTTAKSIGVTLFLVDQIVLKKGRLKANVVNV